ncbi:hypothetical protein PEC302107_24520 [Pectobacterium araliae]|uniref:hypothetical protein n=1 Tax=Pectobacterium araliae TaxID=3073862 RepID=UPI00207F74E2|nr:hypothetical protein PEC302107_24520 [Pectobacterium carotovorum subsp. carotovorum]
MSKTIDVINSGSGEGDIESKWFLIDYNEDSQNMSIKLKENEVKKIFTEIRERFESNLLESYEGRSFRTVAGKYGNAISSLKRSIMQEFVVIVAGLFLHYFSIDNTYATAKEIIKALFGLSIKREVILSSFSTKDRTANRKSKWFGMKSDEKKILYECFNGVIDASKQYEGIKKRIDALVSATKQ